MNANARNGTDNGDTHGLSRRTFLRLGAGAAAAVTAFGAAGCDSKDARLGRGGSAVAAVPSGDAPDIIAHALNRLTYGMRPGDYARVAALTASPAEAAQLFVAEQLAPEKIDDAYVDFEVRRLEVLAEPLPELYEYKEHYLLSQLTQAALLRAVPSRRQLQEVMVQFWSDHFNIDSSKGECRWLKAADDRDVIRKHAMGSFPEMLRASALSPAMLWYLDGRVNRRASDRPNENYARELLELHTLGVHGGYTQADVMEVARCLTGWTVRDRNQLRKGVVEFHPEHHDNGAKNVLGHDIPAGLGKGDLDHVLEIVALHPATAQHLAEKLCRRFIADPAPPDAVESVAAAFIAAKGNIRETLKALFSAPAFSAAENRGTRFRRPFEFVAAALRATNAKCRPGDELMRYLVSMGHAPYQYPTPEGYTLNASPWMGTLLWRWNFVMALTGNKIQGTTIDAAALRTEAGSDAALMAAMLGRSPAEAEKDAWKESGDGIALMLCSPGFQYC